MGTNTTSSYLDPPQLHGVLNKDGTYTLSALEMKKQSDFNYYVAKMIQGGLNLANLNKETNQVFTNIEGDVTELGVTAQGLTLDVSNLSGDLTALSVTVDGLSIADETGSYTIIDGDKLVSKDHDTNTIVVIEDGGIKLKVGTALQGEIYGTGIGIMISPSQYLQLGGKVEVGLGNEEITINGYPVRITSAGNMAINSLGKIYIGNDASYSGNVDIGQAGGTVNLNGSVYINGVLQ